MKRFLFAVCFFLMVQISLRSQTEDTTGYQFTFIKKLNTTPVKDQYKTSTCWSFSVLSMLESELLRLEKGEYNLSEMYIVRKVYIEKAEKYIRMHGTIGFSGGGALNDVPQTIQKNGILPETLYDGKKVDSENHLHGEMDEVLKNYLDGVLKNRNNKLSPVWKDGFCALLDTYLGVVPEKFEWDNRPLDASEFAASMGLNMDDYILISSFTHHPFYEKFIVEVPDNWSWGEAYNVALDELIETLDHSLMHDFSVAWAADVSEPGFSFSKGIAVVPEDKNASQDKKKNNGKIPANNLFEPPLEERKINQEMRQEAFDNYLTTDDHGMHITGMAKDQDGNKFYYVKNSWGTSNPYNGYLYVTEQYVRFKTLTLLVNRNALPKDLAKKLNL